jgi:hypothetical protein
MDKVGYKRPPKQTQFRPGQSGNPGGRPKASASFQSELLTELCEPTSVIEAGARLVVSKQRAIIKALVRAAVKGDIRAVSTVIGLTERETAGSDVMSAADAALVDEFIDREIKRRTEQSKNEPES